MEFKGTKGKWIKTVRGKNILVESKAEIRKGLPMMKVKLGYIYDDDCSVPTCCNKEEHANALLISKAPEMLEFIKEYYKYLNIDDQKKATKLIKEATEI